MAAIAPAWLGRSGQRSANGGRDKIGATQHLARQPIRRRILERADRAPPELGIDLTPARPPEDGQKRFLTPFSDSITRSILHVEIGPAPLVGSPHARRSYVAEN